MESFWLAETLKYTYMLQLDTADSIDLEKYVMNTVRDMIMFEKACAKHLGSPPFLGRAMLPCRCAAFVVGRRDRQRC
jgi:hypothetical protein